LVVDTSAVVALLLNEASADSIARALDACASPIMSAATRAELGIVVEARAGAAGKAELFSLLEAAEIDLIPLDGHGADRAIESWRRFGKGRHPAGLNFGDCFTYSLAEHFELPILCVGNDFAQTDATIVDLALYSSDNQ
jgi:ribonuclease VapC